MYNSITEEKIKQIPFIDDIDIDRLPQELTRVYARIVSLRRQFAEDVATLKIEEFKESLVICQTLANNLETILISSPNHPQKESIAFVAATAHNLIQKMGSKLIDKSTAVLEVDTISPLVSGIVLFLIGNSQADAAEMSQQLFARGDISKTNDKLITYIRALAKGNLMAIYNNPFVEGDINREDFQEAALDYLWKELGLGIYSIVSTPKNWIGWN